MAAIGDGNPARIKLTGHSQVLYGEVGSVARDITISNARANLQGLASVNPIYTCVRLAQCVPVRIQTKEVPDGLVLVVGMTATIEVEQRSAKSQRQ